MAKKTDQENLEIALTGIKISLAGIAIGLIGSAISMFSVSPLLRNLSGFALLLMAAYLAKEIIKVDKLKVN